MIYKIDRKALTGQFIDLLKPKKYSIAGDGDLGTQYFFRVKHNPNRRTICSYLFNGKGTWLGMTVGFDQSPEHPGGAFYSPVEFAMTQGVCVRSRFVEYRVAIKKGSHTSHCFGGGVLPNEDSYAHLEVYGFGPRPVTKDEFSLYMEALLKCLRASE